jgi:hypothetical protein
MTREFGLLRDCGLARFAPQCPGRAITRVWREPLETMLETASDRVAVRLKIPGLRLQSNRTWSRRSAARSACPRNSHVPPVAAEARGGSSLVLLDGSPGLGGPQAGIGSPAPRRRRPERAGSAGRGAGAGT